MKPTFLIATTALVALGLTGCGATSAVEAEPSAPAGDGSVEVGLLLAGQSDDGGFMESGFQGLERAERDFGVTVRVEEGLEPEQGELEDGLRQLADSGVDLVIAHGGQNAAAAEAVAPEYPNTSFVVTQAEVKGPNLAGYEVLQEESAWLAGAAAGLLTETGTVGHMSGIRPVPGLKGRAAFVDGVRHTAPDAKVLTNFSGDQDDVELSRRIAAAEIEAGADYIFTMLNAGRPGVAQAIREADGEVRQFGNVRDFTKDDPEVFVGSAIADSGAAAYRAVGDFVEGTFEPGTVTRIGLEEPDAVRLTLAPDVPDDVRQRLDELTQQIIDGEITVKTEYGGDEFTNAEAGL